MPWLTVMRADDRRPAAANSNPFAITASLAVASCWYSLSLARMAVRVGEMMATEAFGA
jgi:hypothetical protein